MEAADGDIPDASGIETSDYKEEIPQWKELEMAVQEDRRASEKAAMAELLGGGVKSASDTASSSGTLAATSIPKVDTQSESTGAFVSPCCAVC